MSLPFAGTVLALAVSTAEHPMLSRILAAAFLLALAPRAQITTSQYDNARTGANVHETILTPRNVNARSFGRLFRLPVDGDVYAQPLYMRGVPIAGKGRHGVVFIATEHDSVYAFDSAGQPLEPLWHASFAQGRVEPVRQSDVGCPFITPEIGITSTPVIDAAAGTLYVLARTREPGPDGQPHFFQRLHALDISSGAERPGSPVLIRASASSASAGFLGLFSGTVTFNASRENPRAALSLVHGMVWLTWASSCDFGPYYGWVIAYDARTLKQAGVFNASPDGTESGIWASDTGPAADGAGNVYLATGNGRFDAASGGRDYGDSVLKLRLEGNNLSLRDYFTPFNQSHLNDTDKDLGSGGVLVVPDQSGAHPHLLVAAGKEGVVYLLDRDRMGHFHSGSNANALQTVTLPGEVFSAPAFWNGRLYYLASHDVLKAFSIWGGRLSPGPISQAAGAFHEPGATPSISANGNADAIVWAVESRGWAVPTSAILHAWDALDLTRELYNSEQVPARDFGGPALRFTIPAIVDGRVYIGTKGEVDVYGLLAPQARKTR